MFTTINTHPAEDIQKRKNNPKLYSNINLKSIKARVSQTLDLRRFQYFSCLYINYSSVKAFATRTTTFREPLSYSVEVCRQFCCSWNESSHEVCFMNCCKPLMGWEFGFSLVVEMFTYWKCCIHFVSAQRNGGWINERAMSKLVDSEILEKNVCQNCQEG